MKRAPLFSRDTGTDPDWLKDYEANLDKTAVQPADKDRSMYDQISHIIDRKSKFSTVEDAVLDLRERTGLNLYLKQIASQVTKSAEVVNGLTSVAIEVEMEGHPLPSILAKIPGLEGYLRQFIKSRFGHVAVSAVISELPKLFSKDGFGTADEDSPELKRFINDLIVEELKNHTKDPVHPNMGKNQDDIGNGQSPDMFELMTPAKF